MPASEEAARALRICAACMYCDALCPVFPALAHKRGFAAADLHFLAHLCHNCRDCWDACQYAPPHPFAINLPATLAAQRLNSYADHVWPRALAPMFHRPTRGAAVFALVAVAISALVVVPVQPSWLLLSNLAGLILALALLSLIVTAFRFLRTAAPLAGLRALVPALRDGFTLRHLGGATRRRLHHAMAAGLLLDLVSTLSAAALQHVWQASPPYASMSLPVLAGAGGGIAALVGAGGLLALEARSAREDRQAGEAALNVALLSAIALVASSGLLLLVLRETAAMRPLLALHFGLVCGLFALLPVSKLLHAPFRAVALWRAAAERNRP